MIIGCDEVGRGSLAGPVVAAVASWSHNSLSCDEILLIKDSKKLSKKNRYFINKILVEKVNFAIGEVPPSIIDKINILEATKLAMHLAYKNFITKYQIFPTTILVDGNFIPFKLQDKISEIVPIIKGDNTNYFIAASSIIAKEFRDSLMANYHNQWPQYHFHNNSGYGTAKHCQAIKTSGYSPIHRLSFKVKGLQ